MAAQRSTPLNDHEREMVLRRRLERQSEFYRHLIIYLATCTALWAFNLWSIRHGGFMQTDKWWAFIPTAAWGFGVLTHGISVALSSLRGVPFVSIEWEERKVRDLMHDDLKANSQ